MNAIVNNDGRRNVNVSGVISKNKRKLGNNGRESKRWFDWFFDKRELRMITEVAKGMRSTADERMTESNVKKTKPIISVLLTLFPVV